MTEFTILIQPNICTPSSNFLKLTKGRPVILDANEDNKKPINLNIKKDTPAMSRAKKNNVEKFLAF